MFFNIPIFIIYIKKQYCFHITTSLNESLIDRLLGKMKKNEKESKKLAGPLFINSRLDFAVRTHTGWAYLKATSL